MKNVSVIYTKEWFIENGGYWQLIGLDTSADGYEAYSWVRNQRRKWPEQEHLFRLREFTCLNSVILEALESNSYKVETVD